MPEACSWMTSKPNRCKPSCSLSRSATHLAMAGSNDPAKKKAPSLRQTMPAGAGAEATKQGQDKGAAQTGKHPTATSFDNHQRYTVHVTCYYTLCQLPSAWHPLGQYYTPGTSSSPCTCWTLSRRARREGGRVFRLSNSRALGIAESVTPSRKSPVRPHKSGLEALWTTCTCVTSHNMGWQERPWESGNSYFFSAEG